MIHQTPVDAARAKEISVLFGGNGLSSAQAEFRVAERLAAWREQDGVAGLRAGVVVDGVTIQATGLSYQHRVPDDALSHLKAEISKELPGEVDKRETRG